MLTVIIDFEYFSVKNPRKNLVKNIQSVCVCICEDLTMEFVNI